MAASAVAGGAVAAAGGFPLLAVSDHASYDQAYHNGPMSKVTMDRPTVSSTARTNTVPIMISFLWIAPLGAANRPQHFEIYTFAVSLSASL